jgi:transposase
MVTTKGKLKYSVSADHIDSFQYIEFLKNLIQDRARPLILLVDRASFHRSQEIRDFVRAHRAWLRAFFLPRRTPEMNPDEQCGMKSKTIELESSPLRIRKT